MGKHELISQKATTRSIIQKPEPAPIAYGGTQPSIGLFRMFHFCARAMVPPRPMDGGNFAMSLRVEVMTKLARLPERRLVRHR